MLTSLKIEGYRPFRDFTARLGPLVVLAGANGCGKSSLFEFLRFLRDSVYQDIPPEIVAGSVGQQIFHRPGADRFAWSLQLERQGGEPLRYEGELVGPVGRTRITFERLISEAAPDRQPYAYMEVVERQGRVQEPAGEEDVSQEIALRRSNQLALSVMTNPAFATLYNLREAMRGWRFYDALRIDHRKIRKTVPIEQQPTLHEDAGNLSSVLHYLMTEHPLVFAELQTHLRSVVPGFRRLSVKARGGPGEVIAFWSEAGVDDELTLADLSDGTLRLLCWIVVALQPEPPALICIDEPDQGVHPRTLPVLAGLFAKAADRTQLLLATHASYFLMQFELGQLAVLRRESGAAHFLRPADSAVLMDQLQDFGAEELEILHRSDELELLA